MGTSQAVIDSHNKNPLNLIIIGLIIGAATILVFLAIFWLRKRRPRRSNQQLQADPFPNESTYPPSSTPKVEAIVPSDSDHRSDQEETEKQNIVAAEDQGSLLSLQESCSSPPSYRS
ncbi:hypothetical protein CPB83DRAFT_895095 [Crepidotus variabilis]|uniref:Uncharacterized protein n=1 Tax=Crepidotus variabilis TaxID=179855 RepID=A0A9P6EDY5_9AGAR|nr:hypothetical protein CPB83DRAFT_895095 [Crepidotus variabilis]